MLLDILLTKYTVRYTQKRNVIYKEIPGRYAIHFETVENLFSKNLRRKIAHLLFLSACAVPGGPPYLRDLFRGLPRTVCSTFSVPFRRLFCLFLVLCRRIYVICIGRIIRRVMAQLNDFLAVCGYNYFFPLIRLRILMCIS